MYGYLYMIPARDPKQKVCFVYDLMTISKIYIEFHKITSFGCPWKVLGGPWEVLRGAFGGPSGVAGGALGILGGRRGLLGILLNSTRKMS